MDRWAWPSFKRISPWKTSRMYSNKKRTVIWLEDLLFEMVVNIKWHPWYEWNVTEIYLDYIFILLSIHFLDSSFNFVTFVVFSLHLFNRTYLWLLVYQALYNILCNPGLFVFCVLFDVNSNRYAKHLYLFARSNV